MATINPSLFAMIGQGFAGDAYVVDGNHLRWQFDPRLGFPRFAFCVEMRPSVTTRGGADLPTNFEDLRLAAGSAPVNVQLISRTALLVRRPGTSMQQSVGGVGLDSAPLVLSFRGTDPAACLVRLRLVLRSPGGSVTAEGQYLNRGDPETVAIASRRLIRRPGGLGPVADRAELLGNRLARLLERPELGRLPPRIADPALRKVYARLIAAQSSRFARATPEWLRRVNEALAELEVQPDQLGADLSVPVSVELVLLAARMDQVSITGALAQLVSVTWIRVEDLMDKGDWKPLACFPAATDERDYRERNAQHFAGRDAHEIAKDRVIGESGPGAEPLDDPIVPPSRPPQDVELASRYLDPWEQRLEPWLAQVLAESLGSGRHQSEIAVTSELTEVGQSHGAGVPDRLQGRDHLLSFEPYKLLLAASSNPVISRLLALGCIDRRPSREPLDYRVRGRWLKEDLFAWVGAAQRKIEVLVAEFLSASPFQQAARHVQLLEALAELAETTSTVSELINTAGTDPVELFALALGVVPANRPLYAPPASSSVSFSGQGFAPDHAQEAVAEVNWALRRRSRPLDALSVPVGACIARSRAPSSGRFETVRNSVDPDSDRPVPAAILPAGPVDEPGAPGQARFFDRYAADGVDYRYGVSESDPFGRWSPFAESPFRWDDRTPPPAPAQVTAELDETGSPPVLALTVGFSWPMDLYPLAGQRFEVHVRRVPPPSGAPVDRAAWGDCERFAGSGAGPFSFDAAFSGAATHDGMIVEIAQTTELREDAGTGSDQQHRVYTVTFRGIVVLHDVNDRARLWAAVGSRNAKGIDSTNLGGPGMAEHFIAVPPPPPVFPPEPLLASYPDAEGRASFSFAWAGTATRRYTPYRAGELELVEMANSRGLPHAWSASDSPALRSAALRGVAPQLRDAFQPLSELLPQGSDSYTDEVGGSLATLLFYTVVATSPAMIPAPWPASASGFVGVSVPRIPEPARPVVLRAAWQEEGPTGSVQLRIAEPSPSSASVIAYELYRIPEALADRAEDWRRMRPVGRFDVDAGSFVSSGPSAPRAMMIADPTAKDWAHYLYRVVARTAGPNGGAGTRSEPSAAVRVVTRAVSAPEAPVVLAARQEAGMLVVQWRALAPQNPVGEFRFTLVRSSPDPVSALATAGADSLRSAADSEQFELAIAETDLPLPLPSAIQISLRDAAGRTVTSDAVPLETP